MQVKRKKNGRCRFVKKCILNRKEKNIKKNILDETSIIRPRTFLLNCKVGYHSGCNKGCSLAYTNIGNYTQLGQFVRVNPRDHIYQNFMISDDIYTAQEEIFDQGLDEFDGYEVKIGHDVWIGDRAIILSHVEIGNGPKTE
mgnify:CR=1 FL=1